MDLKEETILGSQPAEHWYYRAKLSALLRFVRPLKSRSILDIGAGSGFFSRELLRLTSAAEALCVDPNYSSEGEQLINVKPIRFRKTCEATSADLVLLMDVLEHVENDVDLLREYAEKVPVGTYFLLTVPAFQFLWSGHDIFLEHKRRYTLTHLEDVVRRAGLGIEHGCYFYSLVFPLALATRFTNRLRGKKTATATSQLRQHSRAVNAGLSGICRLELSFFRLNRLVGLSVFCLARKPKPNALR